MNQPSTSAKALPTTARGRRTRQLLLEAAERVFGERGFERASIAEITQRADVALGTFYVYFPHKTAIFVELVNELGTRLRRTIATAVGGLTDRVQVERAGLTAFFAFAKSHRNLYRIVRQAEFVDEAVFRAYYRKLADGYTQGLSKAMDAQQIRRMDPECLAYCLMGMADFVGMRWVLWEKQKAEALIDQLVDFIQFGISPHPPHPKETP